MKCTIANSLFSQVNSTLNDVDGIINAGASASNQSYLAKYLTVYITGVYEQTIEEIIWEYSSKFNEIELENFVANQLDKTFRNPDMGNIIKMVKHFSTVWADDLRLLDSKYKDALNSIINNKNLIAHGQPSVITIQDIKNFHKDATKVIEKIDKLFLGV